MAKPLHRGVIVRLLSGGLSIALFYMLFEFFFITYPAHLAARLSDANDAQIAVSSFYSMHLSMSIGMMSVLFAGITFFDLMGSLNIFRVYKKWPTPSVSRRAGLILFLLGFFPTILGSVLFFTFPTDDTDFPLFVKMPLAATFFLGIALMGTANYLLKKGYIFYPLDSAPSEVVIDPTIINPERILYRFISPTTQITTSILVGTSLVVYGACFLISTIFFLYGNRDDIDGFSDIPTGTIIRLIIFCLATVVGGLLYRYGMTCFKKNIQIIPLAEYQNEQTAKTVSPT